MKLKTLHLHAPDPLTRRKVKTLCVNHTLLNEIVFEKPLVDLGEQ